MNYADMIQDATTSIGTGNMTVSGAVITQRRPLSVFANGTTQVPLRISGQSGNQWEISLCTILTPTTFSRDTVLINWLGTTALIDFSAGTKDVVGTLPAEQIAKLMSTETVPFSTTIPLSQVGLTYMAQHTITGATTFVESATKVAGAFCTFELVENGVNTPGFTGMEEDGGSMGFAGVSGMPTQITVERHTNRTLWSAKQAIGAVPVDASAPTAIAAVVSNGSKTIVAVTFSKTMDTAYTPAYSAFTVSGHTVTAGAWASSTVFNLTVSVAFAYGDTAQTVAYTQPGTNNLRDPATNLVANFSGLSITNNALTVPGAPTIGTAVKTGNTTANVPFTAPASNGGATITTYTATSSPGGITGTLTQSGSGTINMSGLTPSTAYTFTVRATNSEGQGSPSAASNSITTDAADTTPPSFSSAQVADAAPANIVITFDETLAAVTPAMSAFAASGKTITAIARSGATITLTVNTAYVNGDTITVTYTKPGSNPIQDAAGNQTASFGPSSVTNNVSSSSYLVDLITSATVVGAFSFARKVRSAYAGSAIRVRQGVTYTDIGFSGSNLDLTALAAAAGGGDLNLVTVYDQSGNGFDLTQATNGNQWLIVSGGVNVTSNGKLAWNPQNYQPAKLVSGTISTSVAAMAAVVSGNAQTAGAAVVSTIGGNSTDPLYAPSTTGGALAARYNNTAASTLLVNGSAGSSMPTSGANTVYSDAAARAITGIQLGADSANSYGWNGLVNEVILWSAALSGGDKTTLQSNQKTYYGTP